MSEASEKQPKEPTPEQVREMVVRNIREAQDPEEANKILEAYAKAQEFQTMRLVVNTVIHYAGNELSPALGYSELLLADMDPEDTSRDSIERIYNSAAKTTEVLRKIGALKRVETEIFGGEEILDLDKSSAPDPKNPDLIDLT